MMVTCTLMIEYLFLGGCFVDFTKIVAVVSSLDTRRVPISYLVFIVIFPILSNLGPKDDQFESLSAIEKWCNFTRLCSKGSDVHSTHSLTSIAAKLFLSDRHMVVRYTGMREPQHGNRMFQQEAG